MMDRCRRAGVFGIALGLVAGSLALCPPAQAGGQRGGGGGHGGYARHSGSYEARPFLTAQQRFNRRFFGQPFFPGYPGVFAPGLGFGLGNGFGFSGGFVPGVGFGGVAAPGLFGGDTPLYDIPPMPSFNPAYANRSAAPAPERSPVELAALATPVVPGAAAVPIPTVTTPFETRPGTLPPHEVAAGPAMSVITLARQ